MSFFPSSNLLQRLPLWKLLIAWQRTTTTHLNIRWRRWGVVAKPSSAGWRSFRWYACTKKTKFLKEYLKETLRHRWLPAQEYEIIDPYGEQLKGLPEQNPCSCMCVSVPSCQHLCPSCHRCWFCKLEGSQAVRPYAGGYITGDEVKFRDFVPVSCRGFSTADAHRDPCL